MSSVLVPAGQGTAWHSALAHKRLLQLQRHWRQLLWTLPSRHACVQAAHFVGPASVTAMLSQARVQLECSADPTSLDWLLLASK